VHSLPFKPISHDIPGAVGHLSDVKLSPLKLPVGQGHIGASWFNPAASPGSDFPWQPGQTAISAAIKADMSNERFMMINYTNYCFGIGDGGTF
jgi:hypothetical protein